MTPAITKAHSCLKGEMLVPTNQQSNTKIGKGMVLILVLTNITISATVIEKHIAITPATIVEKKFLVMMKAICAQILGTIITAKNWLTNWYPLSWFEESIETTVEIATAIAMTIAIAISTLSVILFVNVPTTKPAKPPETTPAIKDKNATPSKPLSPKTKTLSPKTNDVVMNTAMNTMNTRLKILSLASSIYW